MLRLIDRYLIREILPYFFLTLLLLTAIIFAHEASRFAELLVVASRNGLPMEALWKVLVALVPGILVFTIPISLLIGALVGLGRLSGDSELVAMGASGVGRYRILVPITAVALGTSAVMLHLSFNVLPESMGRLGNLKADQTLVFHGLNTQIKPRVFEEGIPKKVLYIEEIDRAENLWRNIFLVDLDNARGFRIWTASSGALRQGGNSSFPELFLRDGAVHEVSEVRGAQPREEPESDVEEEDDGAADAANGSTESSPPEAGTHERERRRNRIQHKYTAAAFQEMTLGIEVTDEKRSEAVGLDEAGPRMREMTWSELVAYAPAEGDRAERLTELHRRLSLPVACLVFALLAVGFGISNVRTGRSFGLLLGIAITIAYYLLSLTGEHSAVTGKLPVWLGMWMANIVLAGVGAMVLFIQRRPGSDALSALRSVRHFVATLRKLEREAETPRADELSGREEPGTGRPATALRQLFQSKLLDRLVLTDLTRFFLYVLGGFTTLFIVITLFQLLNSIARNNVEWTVVANYLFFLVPMIINYMTPMAVLVAVMVTFGILQKTSQVVALKASGQSIYRLAVPVVLGSLGLSAFVFLTQDYVLPFTNRRQNNLRHQIRSGQEPPQTFYQTANQWIFGVDSRIYNYAYFDPRTDTFARLTVLDLSRDPFGIRQRIYARRASWDAGAGEWVLFNGWERRFEAGRTVSFEQFRERRVPLAEGPSYFKKDVRASSSLTVAELRSKIADLSQAGFDVVDLRVALQSKIAFPLACLIMVIVGLPFSLSVGKRGALYGVALGIAIGLAYWGSLGLFEQMGRYEMLPPLLAAWAPNLLFGTGGLFLFLTSRT